jgi:hypothetical protein
MAASPTLICRKVSLDIAALRGNLFPRVTEMAVTEWHGVVHAIEMLGVPEVQKYMRICDAEREVIHRCAKGERIYGAARYSTIARLASTRTSKVTVEDVRDILG